ncbi:uncharacterized protein KY384_003890 [Bacidia gigantensis]|uniref:uncharacterized protein n=1 Tax=Bacidia gigantensis TaxID=2732470 RepID=UPI001D059EFC|nr:uncharacterized protein KY384_003890 [Bacidia gigantensis]KAG8532249.1 hypothetical protein KY384_003890 [Bacidia gigantensis]
MGYQFKLSNVHQHLAIFQWKKDDESAEPSQNIPFNLQFNNTKDTRLSLGYTSPNLDYKTLWTADSDFDTSAVHNIALAWDTMGSANSKIQMWFDGQMVVEQGGLTLWTGKTYPKLGIYRGEQGDHDTAGYTNDFDLWVYRVMIGDGGLDEVAEAGGIQAQSKRGMNNGYQMSKKSVLNNNHEPRGAEDSVAYSAPSRLSRRQNENRASPVGSSGTGLKYRSGPSLNTKREDHLEQGSENDQEVGADDLVTWFAKRHRAVDEESANIRARHEGGQEPEHPKGSGDGNRHKNDGDSPSTESWFVKRNVGGRGFR